MKKLVLSLGLVLCLMAGSASAVQYGDTTKYAAKILPTTTTPPVCQIGEILTYNGHNYVCTPNYVNKTCPNPNEVVKSINPDGSLNCVGNFKASVPCPANSVMTSFNPATGATTCALVAKPGPVPNCNSTLNSTDGVNFYCNSTIFIGPFIFTADLQPFNAGCDWHKAAARNINFTTHPQAVNAWGASCVSACNGWCQAPANGSYVGGTLLAYDDPSQHFQCLCFK